MTKSFNLPIIYFLIFLISKEIFSYDSEKVVILCILSFMITAYYQVRVSVYEMFQARTARLEEEFVTLLNLKSKLETEIKNFWSIFLQLETQLLNILVWVKHNIKLFVSKANKNRSLFNFHIVKDQLNLILRNKLELRNILINLQVKNTLHNFYLVSQQKVDFSSNELTTNFFLEKLKVPTTETTFSTLILNKLNINKEIHTETGVWKNFDINNY